MRLILSFLIFAAFGFAQQDCHKDKITASKNETAQTSANTAAANSAATTATSLPEEAPRISLEDAKKDFDKGTAIFVDTRPAESYNVEHIKGAINIPAGEFETRFNEVAKSKKIIAYCS